MSGSQGQFGGVRAYGRHRGVNHNAVRKAIESKRLSKSVTLVERGGQMVPRIDFALADQEWQRNTDPVEAARNGKSVNPPAHASAPGAAEQPDRAQLGQASAPAGPGDQLTHWPERRPQGDLVDAARVDDGKGRLDGAGALPGDRQVLSGGGETPSEPGYLEHRAKRERYLAEQAELDYLKKVSSLTWVPDVEREMMEIFKQHRANVMRSNSKVAVQVAAETDPIKVERLLNEAANKVFHELSRTFADDAAEGAEERAAATS